MKKFITSVFIFIKNIFLGLLSLLTIASLIGTVAAFWASSCWLCDLASHFKLFFVLLAIVTLLVQLFRKRWLWLLPCLLLMGLNIGAVYPFYTMPAPLPTGNKLVSVSALQFNIFVKNNSVDNVMATLKAKNADIVALEEAEKHWPGDLTKAGIDKLYPYKATTEGSGNVLYSRFPIINIIRHEVNKQQKHIPQENFLEVTLNAQNNLVHVFVVHTITPLLPSHLVLQQDNLNMLAKRVNNQPKTDPIIVLGDFNTSPFSTEYRTLLSATGLNDSEQGLGLQPSWPSIMPVIPIDHVFVSKNIKVLDRSVGPFVAFSDHLPVKADLQIFGKKPDPSLLLKALSKGNNNSTPHCPNLKIPTANTKPIKVCSTCPKPCNTCDPNKKH